MRTVLASLNICKEIITLVLIVLPSFLLSEQDRIVKGGPERRKWTTLSSPFPLSPLVPPLAFVHRSPLPLLSSSRIASRLDRRDEEVIRQAARNDTSFVIAFFDGLFLFSFFFFFFLFSISGHVINLATNCEKHSLPAFLDGARGNSRSRRGKGRGGGRDGMSRWPRFNRHVRGRRFSSPRLMAEPAQMTALMEE